MTTRPIEANPFVWLAEEAKTNKVARSERGVEILDYELCRAFLLDQVLGTDHGNLVERMGLPESRALDFKRRMLLTQNRGETRQRLRRALVRVDRAEICQSYARRYRHRRPNVRLRMGRPVSQYAGYRGLR